MLRAVNAPIATPWVAIAATIAVVGTSPANAQSFDCAKASTQTETAICTNSDLGTLDDEMARSYKAILPGLQTKAFETLRDDQRLWIKHRNRCGGDTECIASAYLDRLRHLTESYDIPPGWSGIYDGPFGEMELHVTNVSDENLKVEFEGDGANYTCGPVSGEGRADGTTLTASSGGAVIVTLNRLGTGLYVPDDAVNQKLKQTQCGARAPDFLGTFFVRR
ncbi:lysozyme inhibitor LprI family protein [Ruegeria sp. 2205SS24-7]|uniref:lysozyme inhibitor LprI family protein n=1 Tax=Ruegeria discodermiae TaxID=3064389 RepID=UPI002742838C|nr:lysozyme inhibitor LprI family protein [Ruegeria sp. 2205SS24-7]MDP5219341.1 lysozyme inhibitor LprI family protein [Ruegeria sp. 2205SS24-7]